MNRPKYSVDIISPKHIADPVSRQEASDARRAEQKALVQAQDKADRAEMHRVQNITRDSLRLQMAVEQVCRKHPEEAVIWLTKAFETAPGICPID